MSKTKSIVTEYADICAISGRPAEVEHHLIFGNGLKPLAEEDGIKIPISNNSHNMAGGVNQIHNNSTAERLSKIAGQLAWEKEYYKRRIEPDGDPARLSFLKRYGRSYL